MKNPNGPADLHCFDDPQKVMSSFRKIGLISKSSILSALLMVLMAINGFCDDSPQTVAVSTSPLVPIAYKTPTGNVIQTSEGSLLESGNCYVTMGVPAVRVFTHVNWLHALVSSDALAFASTKLTGQSSGKINVTDTRVGTPRTIKSGDNVDDMGFGVLFLDGVPWDFAKLHLELAINSSADSTVTQIANGVSSVSQKLPGFQLSTAVNGALSIAQVFDKLLFDQSRTTARLAASFDIVSVGKSTLRTGCYVVFGSDKATDYDKYFAPDNTGHSQLVWDNSELQFKGTNVDDVSYFILTVETQSNLFADMNGGDAPLNSGRAWAAPLQSAELNIEELPIMTDDASRSTAINSIKTDIQKGQTLLLADPDILLAEKKAILKSVSDKLSEVLSSATVKAVASATNPLGGGQTNSVSTSGGSKLFTASYVHQLAEFGANNNLKNKFIIDHVTPNKIEINSLLRDFASPPGL